MTPTERASYQFQAPEPKDVCPVCKRETDVYVIFCEGHAIDTHRCRAHGDVVPMRSAVSNEDQP